MTQDPSENHLVSQVNSTTTDPHQRLQALMALVDAGHIDTVNQDGLTRAVADLARLLLRPEQ